MRTHTDICILGGELPALIAARILQRKGARIHILEHEEYAKFDPAICEFLSGIFIKPLMQRLGFHPTEIAQMLPLDVPTQFICKYKRINFFKDPHKLRKEFDRESVDNQIYSMLHRDLEKSYKVFYQIYHREIRLHEKSFLFRRDLEERLKNKTSLQMLKMRPLPQMMKYYGLKESYAHFVKSLELIFSYYQSELSNHSRFTHLTHLLQDFGYYSVLGQQGLKLKISNYLREKGAVFETFSSIDKIYRSGSKIHRLKMKGAVEDLEFSKLIVNGNPTGFTQYAPDDKKLRSLVSQNTLKMRGRRLYYLYKIHKSLLPYGIRTQGVIFPKTIEIDSHEKRRFPRVLRYMLHLPNQQAGDYQTYLDRLEKGQALLALTYFVSNDVSLSAQVLQKEIFKTMGRLIPFFLPENVTRVQSYEPSFEGVAGDFRQGFIYSNPKEKSIGLGGNEIETQFKNVWLANESNFPSIGLDGQILTGDQLAQLLV